jgi:hypothetical protein
VSAPAAERGVQEVAHAVATSVEPLEVAVVLESAGINDRVARGAFGSRDVFALAEQAMTRAGPDRPLVEPAADPAEPAGPGRPTLWLLLRGVLYAVPAVVTLALLPSVDPVRSALVLGGLVLSWAWCYGITGLAWSHLGNQDPAGARRFLRRALLGGTLLAGVGATLAVLAALVLTSTVQVDLTTVPLLAAQSVYLLAAAVLLMTGREPLLLVALCPALVTLVARPVGEQAAVGIGASVVLAYVFALVATRRSARPHQRLGAAAWGAAGAQFCHGLLVALLVLFPALNELRNENYDALPLSVTLAALPLVLAMGIAEALIHRFRRRMTALLAATSSPAVFARSARRVLLRYELAFALPLVALSAVFGLVMLASAVRDVRYALLTFGYVVLGVALFGAMLLNLMGLIGRVLATLGAQVVALAAVEAHAAVRPLTDTAALAWFAIVAVVGLVVRLALVRRYVTVPVRHR